jgi:hypothetical protein
LGGAKGTPTIGLETVGKTLSIARFQGRLA